MVHTTGLPIYLSKLNSIFFLFVFQLNFLNANFKFPKPSCRHRRRCQRIIDNDVDTFATCSHLIQRHSYFALPFRLSFSYSFFFCIHYHPWHIFTNNISALLFFCPGEIFHICFDNSNNMSVECVMGSEHIVFFRG